MKDPTRNLESLFDRLDTRKKQIAGLAVIAVIGFFFISTQLQVSSDTTIHIFVASPYSTFKIYLMKADATGQGQDSTLELLQVVPYQALWQGVSSNTYSSGRWTFVKVVVSNATLYGVFAVPKHALLFPPSYCEVSVTISNTVRIDSVALK